MICPNCGENNSSNFKFCGMCGTSLEERRPVGAPRVVSTSEGARSAQNGTDSRVAARTTTATDRPVPPAAGPSFLGLNQPFTDAPDRNDPIASRDQSFFGSETFFEQEEPNVGPRRLFLLLVLLAALGAGGWWAFSHYDKIGAAIKTNSQPAATKPGDAETAANNPAPTPKSSTEPAAPDTTSSQPAAPTATSPAQSPAEQSKAAIPPPDEKAADEKIANEKTVQPPPPATKPAEPIHPSRTQNVVSAKRNEARRAAPPPPAPASDDKGDADFRKGEAYLYGRGMPENCNEAVKNLKAASAKQNAKARSAFGTMYATGHCVTRDLPASYSWFALALRADPNNQILEKDLVAVWNQMTPPERQMATKIKQ